MQNARFCRTWSKRFLVTSQLPFSLKPLARAHENQSQNILSFGLNLLLIFANLTWSWFSFLLTFKWSCRLTDAGYCFCSCCFVSHSHGGLLVVWVISWVVDRAWSGCAVIIAKATIWRFPWRWRRGYCLRRHCLFRGWLVCVGTWVRAFLCNVNDTEEGKIWPIQHLVL